MRSKSARITQGTRRAGLVLGLAILLLVVLSATVWAAWGVARRGGLFVLSQAEATATPTRTPRPMLATPTVTVIEPIIVAFTPTPQPAPTAIPVIPVTPEPLPPDLAGIVERYGMDPARRFIVVDVASQKMRIWDPTGSPAMAGAVLRQVPVSTGDESRGYRTLAWYGLVGKYVGTFNAFGVYADDGWYLFEDSGQILIHGAPYRPDADGRKVYQDLGALGAYPASKGCIRLSPEDARWFTGWNPEGVPLVILPR